MERVIPKLRKLYRNCESYIKIETAQKQLVLQSKKIKFLAHLPNQSLLRWIKREMKVLTWFGRASVAQCAPMGPVCPMRPATGSPTHYNVQIRESPAKWPLHCTSLYFNAQSVSCDIGLFLKQVRMLCVKTALSFFKLQITKSGQPSKTKSDWFLLSLWQNVQLFICWCFVMANIGSICTKWKWLHSVLSFCSNCQIHPIWLLMASLSLPTGNAASLNYSAKALTRFPDLLVILS